MRPKSELRKLRKAAKPIFRAVAGALDLARPSLRWPMGGPLNDQLLRQAMIRELFSVISFSAIVETGTFRGSSTQFFRTISDVPIRTVERHPRYYTYSWLRFLFSGRVRVERGDSREFLSRLTRNDTIPSNRIFFYLDAHWGSDLPLRAEIEIITTNWSDIAILIDDFEVPGDPGYGFDEYGEGKRLCREYLPAELLSDFVELYPSLPSELETGRRRGSVLLLSKAFAGLVPQLKHLREA